MQYVELGGTALCVGWVVTVSLLDLPSVTPLSVAGCDRLQLGAPHWATSVGLLQVVDNYPTFCGSRFLAIGDFTFFTIKVTNRLLNKQTMERFRAMIDDAVDEQQQPQQCHLA